MHCGFWDGLETIGRRKNNMIRHLLHYFHLVSPNNDWTGPIVLPIFLAAFLFVVLTIVPLSRWMRLLPVRGRALAGIISILSVGIFLATALVYYACDVMIYHLEPTLIATSSLWGHGHPMYHDIDAASRYSMLYGPVLYIANGLFLKMGNNLAMARLPGLLFAIGSLAILFVTLKRKAGPLNALIGCGCSAAAFSFFACYAYCVAGDSYLILFTCIGLLGSQARKPAIAALVCGISLGLNADIKAHGVLYFLPVLATLIQNHSWKPAFWAIALSLVTVMLPFALPGISPSNYVAWLKLASKHALSFTEFVRYVEWALVIASPIAIAFLGLALLDSRALRKWLAQNRLPFAALVAAMMLTAVPASKEGTGPHHLMPFAPSLAWFLCQILQAYPSEIPAGWRLRAIQSLAGSAIASSLFFVLFIQRPVVLTALRGRAAALGAIAEIRADEARYAGQTIGMGYADWGYSSTFYRVLLVFDGQPYLLDAGAMMDMMESKIPIPQKTLDAMRDGEIHVWLISHANQPFNVPSWYLPNPPLFSPEFRKIFVDHYQKSAEGKYFDVYIYHADAAGVAGNTAF
jgi:hypothetical protein